MKFLPDENGEVACIECLRTDHIHRKGINELVGVEPQGGFRLYIHFNELMRMTKSEFEDLHAVRSGQAAKGVEAEHIERLTRVLRA